MLQQMPRDGELTVLATENSQERHLKKKSYRCSRCTFITTDSNAYLFHVINSGHDEDIDALRFKIDNASRNNEMLNREREIQLPPLAIDEDEEIEELYLEDDEAAECEYARSPHCPHCDFVGANRTELMSHKRIVHKQHYFSCTKCNYVTHIKSRFTKHVKYHSMPMIKCAVCDFSTPYKWNLDRHMRNHGGGGAFACCMCNFTADIKQSLTVHEMNHHTPPVGQSVAGRRRNRVGASDARAEIEAMLLEDEASVDSNSDASSGRGNTSDMLKVEQNDTDSMEVCQEDSNVTIQNNFQNICSALEASRQNKKPRPIPQLIPLSCSTPTQTSAKTSPTESSAKRFKDMFSGNVDVEIVNSNSTDTLEGDRLSDKPPDAVVNTNSNNLITYSARRKKNASFFDKLKERLMTETSANGTLSCKNCGFESKCLSEHSVHEKNCASQPKSVATNASVPSVSSTRCQNCRHRCKSSADLYVHMQTCETNANEDKETSQENDKTSTTNQPDDQPHPMENVVFVWNNVSSSEQSKPLMESLDITINDDSSQTDTGPRSYDPNNVDALHDTEACSFSPTQDLGKRVFKCPDCPFWASTASRFHVHIVGHLNKKPFECSVCNYRSNWRWDITKHIKLKSIKDPDHFEANVLMTDETGRRNYSKYGQYLINLTDDQLIKSIDHATHKRHTLLDGSVNSDARDNLSNNSNENSQASNQMPLDLHTSRREDDTNEPPAKKKKTLWKCKKCDYRNPLKEALLEHVKEHSKQQQVETTSTSPEPAAQKKDNGTKEIDMQSMAYQCGHCNQLSNWKHVIQRHCRLKHNGEVKVLMVERPKTEPIVVANDNSIDYCTKCPFHTTEKGLLSAHMAQHAPSPNSIFKCYFCPYFVKTESDLMQHLALHGISNPEEYVSKAMGSRTLLPDPPQIKRHKCSECPYETNSKSQYMYHEQFHRLPANTPYKCQICNYSVTKRHLLHQHMKVHGVGSKKDFESDFMKVSPANSPVRGSITPEIIKMEDNLEQIPYVWVSAKNEFHKMYKCRYCSYVNSQQCKIPNHEKIHIIWFDGDMKLYKCLECKFTCDNAPKLTEHSKMHGEIYGRIYYPVDTTQTDEEQIAKLRQLLEQEKQALFEESIKKEPTDDKDSDDKIGKMLHFCKKCPSRFFGENELLLHQKFHELRFSVVCKICSFTVPQDGQMASHSYVHTDDYQSKTKMLQLMHETHPNYPQPKIDFIKYSADDDQIWIVADNFTPANEASCSKKGDKRPKMYYCNHCPAKFVKNTALNYHLSLHGGPGSHTCKQCDFTVKNIGNLVKHESLHKNEASGNNTEIKNELDSGDEIDFKNIPLSGTDLFQRKTEAQKRQNTDKLIMRPNDHFPPVLQADPQFGYLMHGNPEFIYPTYMKNGRQKEKRYKCHKCPSAFEKREQYKVHLSLHGSKQRYKCELCDYSVKYYANYVQHMRKHQMNAEAHAERNKIDNPSTEEGISQNEDDDDGNIKLAIKTIPKYTAKSDFQQFSIGDQQTLRLLQRRRSSVSSAKEVGMTEPTPEKEVGRKHHACSYCPYSNQRRDALENHMKKHKRVSGLQGNHECSYCDFSCNQSHFLREHLKIHFAAQKNSEPKCFTHNEGVILTITKVDEDDKPTEMIFTECENSEKACSKAADKIFIQPATGEIVV